ncbi:peptidoglycan-binding protein [Spiractinospora alimapuensis]|uniref:peptidoglycan-binding domain-containing protein n=1 Tax=Spiractinospora alimapuensis TaxID=2820884 RepID=UPI001F1E1FA4|nr:peptidoglycan-binding protein [Spiractinospora alimapuensis]QVQ51943.1 peptidoglycan-binding protein [Spiractinospora alimapuensis]
MTMMRSLARKSTIGLASVALLGGGMVATSATATAEEGPIEPADAPDIMDRPWPEYPNDTDTHINIYAATIILGAEVDENGDQFYGDHPIPNYTTAVEDAVLLYQADRGLGEHGEMKEEFWGHLDTIQFDRSTPNPDWGPDPVKWYYDLGDEGAGVLAIQNLLINYGYMPDNSDNGEYDTDTMDAVKEFQRDQVCEEVVAEAQSPCDDGWVGTVTWRALVTAG